MQCLSNSQDVIGNSCSAREHTVASGTARQSRDPSLWSPWSLCASQWHWESWVLPWLSLQQLPGSPGCDWAAEHQAHPCHELFVVSPECLILAYHTRHFPAGCMAVPFLQWNTSEKASKFCKEPITLNKEKGLIYMEIAVLRNRESHVQKVVWSLRTRLQFRVWDTLGNRGNTSNEMPEQSGFGPVPSPMDWQIHQV